ncbi:unnamed protein product [Sympodiomycopsis kandeliae]
MSQRLLRKAGKIHSSVRSPLHKLGFSVRKQLSQADMVKCSIFYRHQGGMVQSIHSASSDHTIHQYDDDDDAKEGGYIPFNQNSIQQ